MNIWVVQNNHVPKSLNSLFIKTTCFHLACQVCQIILNHFERLNYITKTEQDRLWLLRLMSEKSKHVIILLVVIIYCKELWFIVTIIGRQFLVSIYRIALTQLKNVLIPWKQTNVPENYIRSCKIKKLNCIIKRCLHTPLNLSQIFFHY